MKELEWSQGFPIITLWEVSVAMETRVDQFQSDLAQNLMQPIPHPNDAPDEIRLRSAGWSQRYSCLKVWTDALTDGRTPARVPYYKLTLSLRLCLAKNRLIYL